ncbi:pentraxin-related protein PTX3-like [Thalassophryne amazonica]|uniref:pentraxin-related protein PTX3-like n=1 Tax=Thalassophryne amazonica TaxID=390379 RepID=UPI00147141C1|nr:pentraxin-related protein PTX3-like [Thalassophryne amazonica]
MMLRIWCVLCGLVYVCASLCVNGIEYEENYGENYDNKISEDQQNGEPSATPCQAADLSRWDKLFIALEDSHMRQNILLESQHRCCAGKASLRNQVDKLAKGTCHQCLSSLKLACQEQAEKANLRLQQALVELREEGAERERRISITLHQLLRRRFEEGRDHGAETRMGHQQTARSAGLGTPFGSGMTNITSGLEEQEVTSPLDMAVMKRSLIAIAADLQKVHLQLSNLLEQVG